MKYLRSGTLEELVKRLQDRTGRRVVPVSHPIERVTTTAQRIVKFPDEKEPRATTLHELSLRLLTQKYHPAPEQELVPADVLRVLFEHRPYDKYDKTEEYPADILIALREEGLYHERTYFYKQMDGLPARESLAYRTKKPIFTYACSTYFCNPTVPHAVWFAGPVTQEQVTSRYSDVPRQQIYPPGSYADDPSSLAMFDANTNHSLPSIITVDPLSCVQCRGAKGEHRMIDFGSPYRSGVRICAACFHDTVIEWGELLKQGTVRRVFTNGTDYVVATTETEASKLYLDALGYPGIDALLRDFPQNETTFVALDPDQQMPGLTYSDIVVEEFTARTFADAFDKGYYGSVDQ